MALHTMSAREVETAAEGSRADGGGLFLVVTPTGANWVFRYTAPSGNRREMGLGPCARDSRAAAGESLSLARTSAARARALLAEGRDPIDERRALREAEVAKVEARKAERAADHWTLARCARDYHQRVIEPGRSAKHAAQWIASLENHIPARLWHQPIAMIEPPELLRALNSVKPHERARRLTADHRLPETVQRMRQRLDAIFEDAIFHRRAATNPAAAIKRKMRETMPARSRGEFAALPYAELPTLMGRLRAAEGSAARCLEFAILTAARTAEALLVEWSEIDLGAATWTVPGTRMKSKEAHTVYLSPQAVELLKGQHGLHERWVFPSPRPDAEGDLHALSNMALLAALGRLGMRDRTTVHGLCRSTFSTWANETGAARPDVIEAALAHREADKVRRAYNRAGFAAERAALLRAWADYCDGIEQPAEQRPSAEVLPLARAA